MEKSCLMQISKSPHFESSRVAEKSVRQINQLFPEFRISKTIKSIIINIIKKKSLPTKSKTKDSHIKEQE